MKSLYKLTFLFLSLLSFSLFISCNNDDLKSTDCIFVQNDDKKDGLTDETEQSIMDKCRIDQLTDISEIKSNLLGEWNIIGHGEGWSASASQPCGKVIFTETKFTFDFHSKNEDKLYSGDWDITKNENGTSLLELTGDDAYPLRISIFCDEYMFFDHTSRDGDMYIYEKK